MCEKYNVDYQNALSCLLENPELTDKQIITQYRPDLSINIFGDIIEPDKTEWFDLKYIAKNHRFYKTYLMQAGPFYVLEIKKT